MPFIQLRAIRTEQCPTDWSDPTMFDQHLGFQIEPGARRYPEQNVNGVPAYRASRFHRQRNSRRRIVTAPDLPD